MQKPNLGFEPVRCMLAAFAAALLLSGCGNNSSAAQDAGSGAAGAPEIVLDGGGVVPPPPDGAALCPTGSCNYQTQTGCSSAEACRPTVSDGGVIQPGCEEAGTGRSGAPCTQWTDCARGYLCAGAACHQLCCGGDWSACGAGQSCIRQLIVKVVDAGTPPQPAGVDLCFPVNNCDVFDPASCKAAGHSCQIVDPIGDVACTPTGSGTVGAPCSESTPCSSGFSCVGDHCRRLCRAVLDGGAPFCPSSEGICVHYNRDPAGVGECTPR